MSKPDAAAAALPPSDEPMDSNSTQTDEDMTDEEEQAHPQHHPPPTQPHPLPLPLPQPKKKRYIPPKANSNTFATRKGFLESLKPIELHEVDEDKRKCPICWKQFGEDPDPGFDNSELPVKLRCNHIFGHKCLASVFDLPETTTLALEPLSFVPGKRGYLLRQKLVAYHLKHGSTYKLRDMFPKMLEDSLDDDEDGRDIFGNYWFSIIQDITDGHGAEDQYGDMTGITLMENAIVMDFDLPRPNSDPYLGFATMPGYPKSFNTHMDHVEFGSEQMPPFESFTAYHVTSMPSLAPPDQAPTHPAPCPKLNQFATDTSSSSTDQSTTGASSFGEIDSDEVKTWQMALANETNLDKLSALMKQKADKPGFTIGVEIEDKYEALTAQAAEAARTELAERRSEDRERKQQNITNLLATQLTNMFVEHRMYLPAGPLLATPDVEQSTFFVPLKIDQSDSTKTSFVIPPPVGWVSFDNDLDSDEEEMPNITSRTAIILRESCPKSREVNGLATPKELTWRSRRKTPDDCPVCHAVLFKRIK